MIPLKFDKYLNMHGFRAILLDDVRGLLVVAVLSRYRGGSDGLGCYLADDDGESILRFVSMMIRALSRLSGEIPKYAV